MTTQEQHESICKNLYDEYLKQNIHQEFIWDGPSNWSQYESGLPKLVFLAKEAHHSFHPSTPRTINDRFTKNIARWAFIIKNILNYAFDNSSISLDELQKAYDSIAIVEVKKIDGENRSNNADLKKFAWLGRDYLLQQLNILSPHIIICCGTIEYFDIINNFSFEEKQKYEKKIYTGKEVNCWISNNRLVIDFFHPSTTKKKDVELYEIMNEVIVDPVIKKEFRKLMLSLFVNRFK